MKLSKLETRHIEEHARLDGVEENGALLDIILTAVRAYICSYTGLSIEQADEHEEITIAALAICCDMYDNPECITGNAVIIEEPYTGLLGMFYIDSDTHTWKNGIYTNSLTLSFENIMHKVERGNE